MLGRMAFVALLVGIVSTTAFAQSNPSPPPAPPQPGTREYTEAFAAQYQKAQAEYDRLSAGDADLKTLESAFKALDRASTDVDVAAIAEALKLRDVKVLKERADVAWSQYRLKKDGSYDVAEAAKQAWDKAEAAYLDLQHAKKVAILNAVGVDDGAPKRSARHQALLDAQKKKDAEKEQENPQSTPNCSSGGGLAGAMNSIACQEQHSGSGH